MHIWLNEDRACMWFLGDPKQVKVSLTFVNPGPIEVDFPSLGEFEQANILLSLQKGLISVDSEYEELRRIHLSQYKNVVEEVVVEESSLPPFCPPVEEEVKEVPQAIKDKVLKLSERQMNRCRFIHARSARALIVAISLETDIDVLLKLVEMEKTLKKPRPSVVAALEENINKLRINKIRSAETDTVRSPVRDNLPYDSSISETDDVIVQFYAMNQGDK